MKTNEKKQLHEKTVADLTTMLAEHQAKLFSHKMEKEQGKLSDTSVLGRLRDDIARIATIIRMKERTERSKNA